MGQKTTTIQDSPSTWVVAKQRKGWTSVGAAVIIVAVITTMFTAFDSSEEVGQKTAPSGAAAATTISISQPQADDAPSGKESAAEVTAAEAAEIATFEPFQDAGAAMIVIEEYQIEAVLEVLANDPPLLSPVTLPSTLDSHQKAFMAAFWNGTLEDVMREGSWYMENGDLEEVRLKRSDQIAAIAYVGYVGAESITEDPTLALRSSEALSALGEKDLADELFEKLKVAVTARLRQEWLAAQPAGDSASKSAEAPSAKPEPDFGAPIPKDPPLLLLQEGYEGYEIARTPRRSEIPVSPLTASEWGLSASVIHIYTTLADLWRLVSAGNPGADETFYIVDVREVSPLLAELAGIKARGFYVFLSEDEGASPIDTTLKGFRFSTWSGVDPRGKKWYSAVLLLNASPSFKKGDVIQVRTVVDLLHNLMK